ncbi:MAG: hypothetical protein LBB20_03560 [Puniceicoccales bacterium]|jgi:hypothetical protein|nr:hypothetical protein [Puniceicoccales bacterium]
MLHKKISCIAVLISQVVFCFGDVKPIIHANNAQELIDKLSMLTSDISEKTIIIIGIGDTIIENGSDISGISKSTAENEDAFIAQKNIEPISRELIDYLKEITKNPNGENSTKIVGFTSPTLYTISFKEIGHKNPEEAIYEMRISQCKSETNLSFSKIRCKAMEKLGIKFSPLLKLKEDTIKEDTILPFVYDYLDEHTENYEKYSHKTFKLGSGKTIFSVDEVDEVDEILSKKMLCPTTKPNDMSAKQVQYFKQKSYNQLNQSSWFIEKDPDGTVREISATPVFRDGIIFSNFVRRSHLRRKLYDSGESTDYPDEYRKGDVIVSFLKALTPSCDINDVKNIYRRIIIVDDDIRQLKNAETILRNTPGIENIDIWLILFNWRNLAIQ